MQVTIPVLLNNSETLDEIIRSVRGCLSKSVNGEIGGFVYLEKSSSGESYLRFDEYQTRKRKEILGFLSEYANGNFENIEHLATYGRNVIQVQREFAHGDEKVIEIAEMLLTLIQKREVQTQPEIRLQIIDHYRTLFLVPTYVLCQDEVPADDPNFYGTYHIHTHGEPADLADFNGAALSGLNTFVLSIHEEKIIVYAITKRGPLIVPLPVENIKEIIA